MQSKHVEEAFLLLTRIRSSPGAFADLQRSVSDAAEFYRAQEGSSTEKLFWSQYAGAEHSTPLSDQLKQLVELHKAAEVAMKDFIVRMWPGEPLPTSYSRKYALEAIIKLLFIPTYHDKCLLFMLELY